MVLNDVSIKKYCEAGMVTPYEPKMVNPASLDLRWSGNFKLPDDLWHMCAADISDLAHRMDSGEDDWQEVKGKFWGELRNDETLVLLPQSFVLVDTMEFVTMPQNLCGNLMLKSSRGREGLEHLHAGFFDPGFSGTATLELVNVAPWPVAIKKGQPLVQLVFMECYPPAVGYDQTGRYNGQAEPQPSK